MQPAFNFSHTVSIPKPRHFERHVHSSYEFLLFLRGDADYVVEGLVYHLHPWDLLLIPPRSFHQLRPRSEAPYDRFVIHFSEELLPPSFGGSRQGLCDLYALSPDTLPYQFFHTWMSKEEQFCEEEMREYIAAMLPAMLLYLKHTPEQQGRQAATNHPILEQMLRYIDENPTQPITASALSAKFFVSTSWIVHIFRQELGISLMQYVEKKRILYAQSCLRNGKTPIEVAEHCGYDSYVTFYRQYKRVLGVSPRERQ